MIHLHNHTDASILDGGQSVEQLVQTVVELDMPAVAITDHGNMINALSFQKECEKKNIKPIIGCEFYVGEHDTHNVFHLILIAKNNIGLRNLYKLNTYAYIDNFYKKPRIDGYRLVEYHEGLICTTACLGSEFAQFARETNQNDLDGLLNAYKRTFGDDFYIELQANSLPEQDTYNTIMAKASSRLNIKLTVSCDTHYSKKEDYEVHDTLLCMQTQKKKEDTNRFKFASNDFYLKDDAEIGSCLLHNSYIYNNIFLSTILYTTREIADKCNAHIETGLSLLPHVPGVIDESLTLAQHCNEGFNKRLQEGAFEGLDINKIIKRVFYELSVIKDKGYSGYFLIVEDFIKEAERKGIYVGDGRGSACGSEVAFILNITRVEPIKYGLLFERFLNPERMSAPDIDSDFDNERRDEMITYVQEKYGKDNVAHIMAKGTLSTIADIRKVMTVYGYDMRAINVVSKAVSEYKKNNPNVSIDELKNSVHTFGLVCDSKPNMFNDMKVLENLISHISKHAAGVAICSEPIFNYIPCMRDADDHTMLMTQWDKHDVEEVGIYKFDFLGLKTLTLFRKTIENIKRNKNIDISLKEVEKIAWKDPKIYEHLNSGNLSGIFQFSAPSGKKIINDIKPKEFKDVIAAEALCRPGVKEVDLYISNKKLFDSNGSYPVPEYWHYVKDILEDTYGAIVYQEQTMLLMNKLAGWTLGKADKMRKVKNLEEYREEFAQDCMEKNVPHSIADAVFDRFDLGYTFNKSHAAAYAIESASTCWFSYYYPVEFMSALMSIEMYSVDNELFTQIQECRRRGIEVIPPDINISEEDFVPFNGGIMYPLTGIKQVGSTAVKEILSKRGSQNIFESLEQFKNIVAKNKVNSRVVRQLIYAGTFDGIERLNRIQLSDGADYRHLTYDSSVKRNMEYKTFGFYLTTHPTLEYTDLFRKMSEGKYSILGIVKDLKETTDRNGNKMAFFKLENYLNTLDCVMFSYDYARLSNHISNGQLIRVTAIKDNSYIVKEVHKV